MTLPAWQRRGIVPAPERDERERQARLAAKALAVELAAKIQPDTPFQPGAFVAEHAGAVILERARELGVGAEDFRIWVMCGVIEGWPDKVGAR